MFEEEIHLRDYLNVIVNWRWMIIALVVPIVLFATLKSFRYTPIYHAKARILIERMPPNIVSFADPNALNNFYWDPQLLETQINIIKSYAVAERVLEKFKMMDQTMKQPIQEQSLQKRWKQAISSIRKLFSQIPKLLGAPEPPPLSEAAKATVQKDRMVMAFLGMITITPVQESRLVDIGITSTDPEQAALIANTLVETYIEHNLEAKTATSRDAVRWLVEEVETARKKLADSETAMQQYKEQQAVISFEDRQNIVMQKLSDLNAAVNDAKIRYLALETQYQKIQGFKKGEIGTIPQVINNPLIQQLKIKLLSLETEYLEALKKFREKHPEVASLKSQLRGVQNQLAVETRRLVESMENEYELALAQQQALTEALEEQKRKALELNQKAIMYEVLKKEVESNRKIYNALLERTKETSITERLETTNIQIVDRAVIPTFPINRKGTRSILLAMIVGLVLGTTLAFFLEYWNDKITTPEDIKRYLDIPFLGIIPKVSVKHAPKIAVATTILTDPHSPASEAYRGLWAHVAFSGLDAESSSLKAESVLLITSAEPSEGKSCTVANLGIAVAQSGQKTLIVDADFRKPMMDQIFHLKDRKPGLANILMDYETDNGIGEVIQNTDIKNLDVVPCGKIHSNPSELLSLRKTGMIIKKLGEQYEKILIDSPPINVVTDPLILSQLVSGVILIFLAGKTKRNVVQHARDQLRDVGATILGGVINNVDVKKSRYRYYYYHMYHYPKYYGREKDKAA